MGAFMIGQDGMRSPLGRALGRGSAKHGADHWIVQRLSALALIPLGLWFVVALMCHVGAGYPAAHAWLHRPAVGILLVLLLIATFYHLVVGVEVVIEDYVHSAWVRITSLVLLRFAAVALAVAGIFSVLRIAVGG
jgi:succinate dehydrogenase / fumarate reductase membrane anchor subunit